MRNGQTMNKRESSNQDLYEIIITPKHETEKITVYVFAKNRLEASNYLIRTGNFGKQHEIRLHTSAAWLK